MREAKRTSFGSDFREFEIKIRLRIFGEGKNTKLFDNSAGRSALLQMFIKSGGDFTSAREFLSYTGIVRSSRESTRARIYRHGRRCAFRRERQAGRPECERNPFL